MKFVESSNCPNGRVSLAVLSGSAPMSLQNSLTGMGVRLILTPKHEALLEGEAHHPDMQLFYGGGGRLVICPELYEHYISLPQLKGATLVKGDTPLSAKYPRNIAYNACKVGRYLICNADHTDGSILEIAKNDKLKIIPVKQGYAKCSIAVVSEGAVMTSDNGIYNILQQADIDVLKISHASLALEGFDYGFIGGACGKLSKEKIAFFGNIKRHPDYGKIFDFCKKHGCNILNMSNETPQDCGSLILIDEE